MYLLEKVQSRVNEAGTKAKDLKMSLESLCGILFLYSIVMFSLSGSFMPYFSIYNVDSAKAEIDALAEAENELMMIERDLQEVERVHFIYCVIYSATISLPLL